MNRIQFVLGGLALILASVSFAAHGTEKNAKTHREAAHAVTPAVEPPVVDSWSDSQIVALAKSSSESAHKHPARMVASQENLSPECTAFVNAIVNAKTGDEFYTILSTEDKNYASIPDSAMDKKFLVARMSTWLPMRGIVWRAAPLIHHVIAAQEGVLLALRNVAEQIQIMGPGSHAQAQFDYLTMPAANLVDKQILTEDQFMDDFLGNEVYRALATATNRIEVLSLNSDHNHMMNYGKDGSATPMFFDARIRFGSANFNDTAAGSGDRFKILDEGVRWETLSRLHRRMAAIAGIAGYDWNGHFKLRQMVAEKMVFRDDVSSMLASISGGLGFNTQGGDPQPFAVEGATRHDRDLIAKNSFPQLYKLRPGGEKWMRAAYWNLHKSYVFLNEAWKVIQSEPSQKGLQVDPGIILARGGQVNEALANMAQLVGTIETQCDPQLDATSSQRPANMSACYSPNLSEVPGVAKLTSTVSGETEVVNLKGFYYHPPQDLKTLLPTGWAGNEDLKEPLVSKTATDRKHPDVLTMQLNGKSVPFRNYGYGRATAWDSGAYGTLFPNLSTGADVAERMRVLNEVRGTRMVTNGLTLFVR